MASHTAYLGAAVLIFSAVAVWRRRELWPWVAGALGLTVLALGPWLIMKGVPVQVGEGRLMTPLGWIIVGVPFLGRLTHWYRAASVAVLLLAAPVSTLARGWRGTLALGAVIMLDLWARMSRLRADSRGVLPSPPGTSPPGSQLQAILAARATPV